MRVPSESVEVTGKAFKRASDLPSVLLEVIATTKSFDARSEYRMLGYRRESGVETFLRLYGCRTGSRFDIAGLMVVRAK